MADDFVEEERSDMLNKREKRRCQSRDERGRGKDWENAGVGGGGNDA